MGTGGDGGAWPTRSGWQHTFKSFPLWEAGFQFNKTLLALYCSSSLGIHRPEGVWLGEAWVVLGLLGPLFSGLSPSEPRDRFHCSALRDHRNEH